MRCFIGIPVPPALAATLTANPVPPTARPVPAANLHLTLAFLGERSRSQLEPLLPPLKNALARLPAFTVTLNSNICWCNPLFTAFLVLEVERVC